MSALRTTYIASIALLSAIAAPAQTSYTIRSLGTTSVLTQGNALTINNHGQVGGEVWAHGHVLRPAIWNGTTLTVLSGTATGTVRDVNDVGMAVGDFASVPNSTTGVLWAPVANGRVMIDLGSGPLFSSAHAYKTNAFGGTCGEVRQGLAWQAAVWLTAGDLGNPQILPLPPGHISGVARAINSSNQVVGTLSSFGFGAIASWQRTGSSWTVTQLPTLPATNSAFVNDINELGVSVGSSQGSNFFYHLVTWQGAVLTDLGTIPNKSTHGVAINLGGDIVGNTLPISPPNSQGFVRPANGAITELNDLLPPQSTWDIVRASDINDSGWIVGSGIRGGLYQPYVMIPTVVQLAAPSPGTAGVINRVTASACTPGQSVFFFVSWAGGETPIPGCLQALDLSNAVLFGASIADPMGNATLSFAVPSAVTNVPLLLQGYDLSVCHTSNVVPFTF